MKPRIRTRLWRWFKLATLLALWSFFALVVIVQTGLADRWARDAIVGQLTRITGGEVKLGAFRFYWLPLRAELDNLTIRGREPQGSPPFFHADQLVVDLRIVSLFGRKFSLDEVRLERPTVHVRVEADGTSNVPLPQPRPQEPGKPMRERIFDMVIREVRLHNGELLYNDVRTPLVAEGGLFRFALDYHADADGQQWYEGDFAWRQMGLAARRYVPFRSDVAVKFKLTREDFQLQQFQWDLPHSVIRVSAGLESFAKPAWSFRFDGRIGLEDLQEIMRKPNSPAGRVEFSGEGRFADGKVTGKGRYTALEIDMPYEWFHSSGITSRGSYTFDNRGVVVPDFQASALGGTIQGRVEYLFNGMKYRVESRAQGMNLSGLMAAVDHPGFPVRTFQWGGTVDIDAVTSWEADFKHVVSRGLMRWSPPLEPQEGEIPATARLEFYYVMDQSLVDLKSSEIATATSRVTMNGRLGARDSALEVSLRSDDLREWNDFIHALRGPEAERVPITGRATWQGRVLGRLDHPTFLGHMRATEAAYGRLTWSEIEGDVTYSPEELRLERAQARHDESTAALELWLELADWSFRPESLWSLSVDLVRASTDDLQELFGTTVDARGLLTGQFRGRGTRADPELTGLFDIAQVEAWNWKFERARGLLGVRRDEVKISNAEVRLGSGRITGDFAYLIAEDSVEFDLTGAVIPLERIERIQTERLPLGGQLSFQVAGKGPVRAITAEGTLRLVDFRVGDDTYGSFQGDLRGDGRRIHVALNSAMATGRVAGALDVVLEGDYPMMADVTVENVDLDAFIVTGLRLHALTGHSRVDGRFHLTGMLAKPETITIEADVSRLNLDYQYLKLENVGPMRFAYRREEVRVERAQIRGPDTDFTIAGYARFAADRQLNLNLAGTVNLRLLGGFFPDLDARGAAQVNASVEGTLSLPRITGNLRVENASARYAEFPAGLSQVTGEFVFDRNRMVFENVGAETGGGRMTFSGTVTYGEGPFRYDLNMRAAKVRIRYPEGMSWLAGGTLRLSGTAQGGLLSGRVVVERLYMAPGFEITALFAGAPGTVRAPRTDSPFIRNLQFDIEAVSSPEARLEWTGSRFESEASLRVRGTWEYPILAGHIHLLSGEMSFRGNRYRLTRGELNFPLRVIPDLNVEATTTIRQYEITLNFTGRADRLQLAYRSDPPLPDSDIITLLALGRTGEESDVRAAPGQQQELGATALLSEAIASQVGGRIERLFGVSRFRVDPFLAGTGTEQNASARITVEQQLTRDLTVTYITNVTSTQQQVIQFEYTVSRDISVIALRDQNGTFGLDFKLKRRFR